MTKVSIEVNDTELSIMKEMSAVFGEETLKDLCEGMVRRSIRGYLDARGKILERVLEENISKGDE